MMLDKQTLFSDNQTLAINIGSALSTNSLDLGVSGTPAVGGSLFSDVGVSNVQVLCQVTDDATSGGAATLQVSLVSGTGVDGNGQINAGETVLSQTAAIALATLAKGYQFRLGATLPRGNTARYLALKYTVATANMTGGKITGGIVLDKQTTTGM